MRDPQHLFFVKIYSYQQGKDNEVFCGDMYIILKSADTIIPYRVKSCTIVNHDISTVFIGNYKSAIVCRFCRKALQRRYSISHNYFVRERFSWHILLIYGMIC